MNNKKAHAAILATNILFAANFSSLKYLIPAYMPPLAVNLLRVGITVPLFWLLYLLKPGRAGIDKKDIPRFIICAVNGIAINQILFVKGVALTTSIHASLLTLGTPIFITAAGAWLLKEKFTTNKAIGLLLGITGAALIVISKAQNNSNASNILLGNIFVIINTISYALYFVSVKPLMQKYNPVHVIRWVFTIGLLVMIPFCLPQFLQTNFANFNTQAWLSASFVVVGATFLTYLFTVYALKYLSAGTVGSYIYTQPVFATAIGIIFLHEQLLTTQIIAALLIGIGVYVINKN
jgi:drug/metabolite transporter (DMT)-like permease